MSYLPLLFFKVGHVMASQAYVRNNASRVGINLDKSFRNQERKAIYDLGCLVSLLSTYLSSYTHNGLCIYQTAKELPYFTKHRFPNYWPVSEALKQYLKNHRKRISKVKKNKKQQPSQDDDTETQESRLNDDGDTNDDRDDGSTKDDQDEDEEPEEENA
jgi:hypothetical protein